MAPSKRKFDKIEESDSDEPSFGKQILPVANLPDDFDSEPIDGMQYLFTVRRDAKALPQFTRAINPYETPLECTISQSPRQVAHPALPSTEWRECNEKRWRNFHQNFKQPTIGTSAATPQQKLLPDKGERDFWWEFLAGKPKSVWSKTRQRKKKKTKGKQHQEEEDCVEGGMCPWDDQEPKNYDENEECFEDEKANSPQGRRVVSNLSEICNLSTEGEVEDAQWIEPQDLLPTPTGTPTPPDCVTSSASRPSIIAAHDVIEEGRLTQPEPTPQLLKLIDERMALHLLMYFTFWIRQYLREPGSSTYRLTNTHARWISSLLLRIDNYISADDMNLLRNLARACLAFVKVAILERRKGTFPETEAQTERQREGETMEEQACWIIISGIVSIWGQRDLWTIAEDALTGLG